MTYRIGLLVCVTLLAMLPIPSPPVRADFFDTQREYITGENPRAIESSVVHPLGKDVAGVDAVPLIEPGNDHATGTVLDDVVRA